MSSLISALLATLSSVYRSRAALQIEILALRHQLAVLHRSARKRPRLSRADRMLWAWFSRVWSDWRSALVIVKPETVIAWHRKGFRLFWTWNGRRGKAGRPTVSPEIRHLIRRLSRENPLWGLQGRLSRHALRDDPVLDPAQHIFHLCGSDLSVKQPEWHLAAEGAIRPAQPGGSCRLVAKHRDGVRCHPCEPYEPIRFDGLQFPLALTSCQRPHRRVKDRRGLG